MKRVIAGASLLSIAACSFASVAWAQQGAENASSNAVEEIIVTAQKRQERINDVPLSITALTGDQLKARNITSPSDLVAVVPGFNAQTALGGSPVFYIRGIGFADTSPTATPAVTVYTDEVALPILDMSRGAALDLERVEVLKGPQGTLFGENSTGGAVNYIAAKPTDTLHAGGSFGLGRFATARVQGFVSGPLADKVSARLAVEYRSKGDWQYSATRPNDKRGKEDFLNGRLSIAAAPTESMKFLFTASAWRDRSDTQAPQLAYISPSFPFPPVIAALHAVSYTPTNARIADWLAGSAERRDDKFYQFSLRGDIDVSSGVKLTSITAYSKLNLSVPSTADGANFPNITLTDASAKVFAQELRLSGDIGPVLWMVGGNYKHSNTKHSVLGNPFVTSNAQGLYNTIHMINNSQADTYAAFASLEAKLADTVTARGSIRYTKENRDHQGCLADYGDGQLSFGFGQIIIPSFPGGVPTNIPPGACVTLDDATLQPIITPAPGKLNEDNVSWRLGLDWKSSPGTMFYATVAKGYKSGGFTNPPAVFVSQIDPITQESLLTYEVGVKSDLLDRALHIDLAGFYYDYTDKQLQGYVNIPGFGPLPTLVNIPKSRVIGAEMALTARPTTGLRIQLAGTVLDTKVQRDPSIPIDPFNQPTTFVGESFPNTPKYQATADIEQTIPLSDNINAYIGGALQHHSRASGQFGSDVSALARSVASLRSYVTVDLRAGIRLAQPNVRVEVWGTNITNKYYWNAAQQYGDVFVRYAAQPANYGIRISSEF